MIASPNPLGGGARALPSGERLAAAVIDFLVLAVPQAVLLVLIVLTSSQYHQFTVFLEAHSKATNLATNPTFVRLSQHLTTVASEFLYAAEAVTAVYLIFMYLRFGATLGKLALGLRITRVDGSPMTASNAVLRSTVFWIPLLIPVIGLWVWLVEYMAGTLVVLFRPDHRGPEDLLGHTIVVRKESAGRSLSELLNYAPPLAPPGQPPSPQARGGHLPGWGPSTDRPPTASPGEPEEGRI
ncbi:MAG: RDD family protein [Candidatus Dormiibacterota bacterium]